MLEQKKDRMHSFDSIAHVSLDIFFQSLIFWKNVKYR